MISENLKTVFQLSLSNPKYALYIFAEKQVRGWYERNKDSKNPKYGQVNSWVKMYSQDNLYKYFSLLYGIVLIGEETGVDQAVITKLLGHAMEAGVVRKWITPMMLLTAPEIDL